MAQNATTAALHALADWWTEMGVDVDRDILSRAAENTPVAHAKTESPPNDTQSTPAPTRSRKKQRAMSVADWTAQAQNYAAAADSLRALKVSIDVFEGSPLKPLSNKTVVFDGVPNAPVMVIGEGPGGQEDRIGLPFVGKAGQLLDKMLAAISLDRKTNTFITNVNYWRPPGNRNPDDDELAVCRPFVDRMIDLNAPKIIIATGGVAAKSLLETRTGIMRLRGKESLYTTPAGTAVPIIPIFHPAYLLRRPQDKSRTWRDLLQVQARLNALGVEL